MSRAPKVIEADVLLLAGVFDRGARLTKPEARARYGLGERRFRKAVNALRHDGYPVVSDSDAGSVYRKATSASELTTFRERELRSRAMDLLEQDRALAAHVNDHFVPTQLRLVG